MKKFLLLLTTILSFNFNTFSQSVVKPFNLDNVDWEILSCGWGSSPPPSVYYFNHYSLCGDTLYQGLKYKRIFEGTANQYPAWWGAGPVFPGPLPSVYNFYGFFRQDSVLKRNYLRLPSWSNDSLLMDYNLNVGDTIKSGLYYKQMLIGSCAGAKVTSISTIVIGGQNFKVFYTDNFGQKYCNVNRPGYFFIEGLGHINGIFQSYLAQEYYCHPFENCPGVDTILFNTPCHNIAGIKTKKENAYTINTYPNPTSKILTIQLESFTGAREASIKIVNIMGEELISEEIKKLDFEIDVSALPNGIYFLKITDGERNYSTKVIVQH